MEDQTPEPKTEVDVLKAQLAAMRESDKRVVEVYRIMATVMITITALLVGYGWYNNKFNYERDKAAIQRELEIANQEKLRLVSDQIDAKAESASKQLTGVFSNEMQAAALQINAALNDQQKKFDLSINSLLAEKKLLETNLPYLNLRIEGAYHASDGALFLGQAVSLANQKAHGAAILSCYQAAEDYLRVPDANKFGKCVNLMKDELAEIGASDFKEKAIYENVVFLFAEFSELRTNSEFNVKFELLKNSLDGAKTRLGQRIPQEVANLR